MVEMGAQAARSCRSAAIPSRATASTVVAVAGRRSAWRAWTPPVRWLHCVCAPGRMRSPTPLEASRFAASWAAQVFMAAGHGSTIPGHSRFHGGGGPYAEQRRP